MNRSSVSYHGNVLTETKTTHVGHIGIHPWEAEPKNEQRFQREQASCGMALLFLPSPSTVVTVLEENTKH